MLTSDLIKNRILIIGSNGMLGQRLTDFYKNNPRIELHCASFEDDSFIEGVAYTILDITRKNEVRKLIFDFFPDVIINAAAYTNVDKAETERETAWKINVHGSEHLSLYAWTVDALLVQLSTDYIFDGRSGPYSEEDKPSPVNYYGRTKLAGENAVRVSGVRHAIVRSNVLYGPAKYGRPDFVKWVVNSLREGKKISIVTDQINNPTYIDDIVSGINKIIEFRKEGIFNIAGSEFLSRYDFTLRTAEFFDLDKSLIVPIQTSELNQPALRPLKSGLIILKAETELGYRPVSLKESFRKMQAELSL